MIDSIRQTLKDKCNLVLLLYVTRQEGAVMSATFIRNTKKNGQPARPISGGVFWIAPPLSETAIMKLQTRKCQKSRFSLRFVTR